MQSVATRRRRLRSLSKYRGPRSSKTTPKWQKRPPSVPTRHMFLGPLKLRGGGLPWVKPYPLTCEKPHTVFKRCLTTLQLDRVTLRASHFHSGSRFGIEFRRKKTARVRTKVAFALSRKEEKSKFKDFIRANIV